MFLDFFSCLELKITSSASFNTHFPHACMNWMEFFTAGLLKLDACHSYCQIPPVSYQSHNFPLSYFSRVSVKEQHDLYDYNDAHHIMPRQEYIRIYMLHMHADIHPPPHTHTSFCFYLINSEGFVVSCSKHLPKVQNSEMEHETTRPHPYLHISMKVL